MKKFFVVMVLFLNLLSLGSQSLLHVVKIDSTLLTFPVLTIDSVKVNATHTQLQVFQGGMFLAIPVQEVRDMYFTSATDTVTIAYSGSTATVFNPFENKGVTVDIQGGDVVVRSRVTHTEIVYQLKGTTSSGSFKVYSDYRLKLVLSGVSLSNEKGPAINIQSKKRIQVNTAPGTLNTLADGSNYVSSSEDQKATLFSEGQLILGGSGQLYVSSVSRHAICSDDFIQIDSGNIHVSTAGKDAVHSNDNLVVNGGVITMNAQGDGFDSELGNVQINGGDITCLVVASDAKAIKAERSILIQGGKINLKLTGSQTKGLKAKQLIAMDAGTLHVESSGAVVLSAIGKGFDPSYCTAIKCDSSVVVTGGEMMFNQTGVGNKGISAGNNIVVSGGKIHIIQTGNGATYVNATGVTDSYNATCITSDGDILLTGGEVTTHSSGSAGKGISANGKLTIGGNMAGVPVLNSTTTGSSILVSGKDYALPKTIKCDGALTIHQGNITVSSANDGLKSETSITIFGGNTTISRSFEGIESKLIHLAGGVTNVNATNDGLNTTMGTTVGGTNQNDNSLLTLSGGTHYITATSGDAIDSNGTIVMTGGFALANGPMTGVEESIDTNGSFTMDGGTFIGIGSNSQMTKAMNAASKQGNMFLSTNTVVSSTTLMTITINNQHNLTFKPKHGGYKFLISSPAMLKGASYVIYTGGTYSGGTSEHGFFKDGVFVNSGATIRKSGTLLTTGTVNSLTF